MSSCCFAPGLEKSVRSFADINPWILLLCPCKLIRKASVRTPSSTSSATDDCPQRSGLGPLFSSCVMAYQFTITLLIFSLSFFIAVVGNLLLAIMIVKLKRQEERSTPDRRRHFDVLFTALAVGDTLGSCLNYPTLLHLNRLPLQELKSSGHLCEFLGSSSVVYFSYIAILTMAMSLHNIASNTWPFHYFIYLRRKRSKIPFSCVGMSLFVAVVSLTISASGFPLFKLTPTRYFDIVSCAPESSYDSPSKYFYLIFGHLWFWTHFCSLILISCQYVKIRSDPVGWFSCRSNCLGLPNGAWFQISFKFLYLIFWTPFTVVMTIITCTHYSIPVDIIVTVSYVVFLPGVLGPFVYYVTHRDLRDVFNTTILNILLRKGCCKERPRQNNEEIELNAGRL